MKGWTLEKGDCTIVNTTLCGSGRYKVALWCGSGYLLSHFLCYALSAEHALEQVVAYIEQHKTWHFLLQDSTYDEAMQWNMNEEGMTEDESADDLDDTFMWVDATMSGAQQPHYIYFENLRVQTVPEQFYDWFDVA